MELFTVLGDSLAIVRPDNNITEEDLYSYKIQESLLNTYVLNKGIKNNNSTKENNKEAFIYNIKAAKSKYFSIQLGIVDCSPRLFSDKTKLIFRLITELKIPILKNLIKFYISYKSKHRLHLTRKNNKVEVKVEDYKLNLQSILNKIEDNNPVKKIFLINIAYPGEILISRSHGILNNIKTYNNILIELRESNKELVEIIDVYTFTKNNKHVILEDGHHYNTEYHNFIANQIISKLNNIEKK